MNLEQLRRALKAALEARKTDHETLVGVTDKAEAEERTTLNEEETAKVAELRAALAEHDTLIDSLTADVAAREADDARAEERAKMLEDINVDLSTDTRSTGPQVTNEEATYRADDAQRGVSFFQDLVARNDNAAAAERLQRHSAEVEERLGNTATHTPGLVPPQYLTSMLDELRSAGRPYLDISTSHTLPASGMTMYLPKITVGTSVAIQATEGDALSETDMDSDGHQVSVVTHGGYQELSLQALERGIGIDDVIARDLGRVYNVTLDKKAIADTLSTGADEIPSVAFDMPNPTAEALFGKLHEAQSAIIGTEFQAASHYVMHPRRWHWLSSQVTANHPFVQQLSAPVMQAGERNSDGYGGVVGFVAGVPVVLDANIPTDAGAGTEDTILLVTSDELHFWEQSGHPVTIDAERITKANQLVARFVIYGFTAFTAKRRPSAHVKIQGTGLIAPSF